jgi:hypothetical protein
VAHLIYLQPSYEIKSEKLRIWDLDANNHLKDQQSNKEREKKEKEKKHYTQKHK